MAKYLYHADGSRWDHADYLAAMDPRQMVCRYAHQGLPVWIMRGGKLPKGIDAAPLVGGGLLIIETCSVCTTEITYQQGDGKQRRYIYPDWWIHVPGDIQGGNVTRSDCKGVLVELAHDALAAQARGKAVRAA